MTIQNTFCTVCGGIFLRRGATNNPTLNPIVCKRCYLNMRKGAAQ